jgi:uncharacterized membrane protein YeaQ/YmgE (transglycosylase-associated protein family)
MFSLLAWIIVGGIAGWIASILVKTDDQMGCFANIVVGMIGSMVGGALVVLLNTGKLDLLNTSFNDLNLGSIVVSVIGAVIFLGVLKMLRGGSAA